MAQIKQYKTKQYNIHLYIKFLRMNLKTLELLNGNFQNDILCCLMVIVKMNFYVQFNHFQSHAAHAIQRKSISRDDNISQI